MSKTQPSLPSTLQNITPSITGIVINSPDVSPNNMGSSPNSSPGDNLSPTRRKRRMVKGISLKKVEEDPNLVKKNRNPTPSKNTLFLPKAASSKFELDASMVESDINDERVGTIEIKIEDIPDVAPITLNLVDEPQAQGDTVAEIDQRFSLASKDELKLDTHEITDEQFQRRLIRRPSLRRRILANEFSNEDLITIASFILRMEYNLRRKEDKENLVDCMRSSVGFFSNYDRDTVNRCMKYMNYYKKKAKEIIFEVGTIGTTFWVLLKGSVIVRIPIKQPTGEVDAKGEPIMQEVLTDARILPAGSGFGELALMNNKPRAATIVCNEDCEFAVLEKDPFNAILKEKETAKLFSEIDFLVSLPMLKGWSFMQARKFFYVAPIMRYTRGTTLFNQGDEVMKVYIVKKGEFKVSKIVTHSKEGVEDYKDPLNSMFRKNLTKANVEVKTSEFFNSKLGLVGERELIGELEIFSNAKRDFQVTCHSLEALVYEITKKDFKDYILKVESSKNWLLNYIRNKLRFHNERVQSITKSRHTPSEFQSAKKIVDMGQIEQHQDLKDSFNEIVKHGLSVKRLKRFIPTDAPILSEEAEREYSPKKGILHELSATPPRVESVTAKKTITPLRGSTIPMSEKSPQRAAEKSTERVTLTEPDRPTTRGYVGVHGVVFTAKTPEKQAPLKLSVFKNSQDEEKKKISLRRQEFQKRIAKKRIEKVETEPTEREYSNQMTHSYSNNQLRSEMFIASHRTARKSTSRERVTTIDNSHAYVPVAAFFQNSLREKQALNDSDISNLKISPTQPSNNFIEKFQRTRSNLKRDISSPHLKRQESSTSVIIHPIISTNISSANKNDLEHRLKRTLANLHPQNNFKVNEDIGIRKVQAVKTGGITLYNNAISKPQFDFSHIGMSFPSSNSTGNLHVLRMKEIDDMKTMYYKSLNSRSQRMKLIELVGSYYNEKGAHIIFDFQENNNTSKTEEPTQRAVTASTNHKRQKSKMSDSKLNKSHNRSRNRSKEY